MSKSVTKKQFVQTVWEHYRTHGRHDLPWRHTTDPYLIVVSEVMLQQTQVDRVVPKYQAFVGRWGSAQALARAPLRDVLQAWQGLGYNRRARYLHECAKAVTEKGGVFPDTHDALIKLPGIGSYTAGAVLAFAFNKPVPLIETNVRTVYIHHFFADQTDVTDTEILQLVTQTLDTHQAREWYWALMDYGSYLKKTHGNLNTKSSSYTKQSKFAGSNRQIRGAIIRTLAAGSLTRTELQKRLRLYTPKRIDEQLLKLQQEKLVTKTGRRYELPDT